MDLATRSSALDRLCRSLGLPAAPLLGALLAALCAAALSACGPNGARPPACGRTQVSCGSVCADLSNDSHNCGVCGQECPSPLGGSSACVSGHCITSCSVSGLALCEADPNPDGGAPLLTCSDTNLDPIHCGACGNACGATEVCRAGRCAACPIAQCGNICVDTRSDPLSCGTCGHACAAHQACIAGACTVPVLVTFLDPADGGLAPVSGAFTQNVRVDSALRVANVYLDGPTPARLADGGLNPDARMNQYQGDPWSGPTFWQGGVDGFDGGTLLRALAFDEAWRESATDQADHTATGSAFVQRAEPVAAGYAIPSLAVFAGATALNPNAVVPFGVPSLTIKVPAPGAADPDAGGLASVRFSAQVIDSTYNLGEAPARAGFFTLALAPTELPMGEITLSACALDGAGAVASCSAGGFPITIGTFPAPGVSLGSVPLLTADVAGTHTAWFIHYGTGGQVLAPLAAVPFDQPLPLGLPDAGVTDAGYYIDSLVRAENAASVLAVRFDGIDRFDCHTAEVCNRHGFVTGIANPRLVRAVTSRALLIEDLSGHAWFADVGGGAAVDSGGRVYNQQFAASDSGLIAAWIQDEGSGNITSVLYHPGLTTPLTKLGTAVALNLNIASPQLFVFPSGEFWFGWADTTPHIRSGWFDGTQIKEAGLADGYNYGDLPGSAQPVRPGVILGSVSSATLGLNTLLLADAGKGTTSLPLIAFRADPGSLLTDFVLTRNTLAITSPFAVSDDQLKAIAVTQDPGSSPRSLNLWLIDLAGGGASLLYSSPLLIPGNINGLVAGPGFNVNLQPHFAHSATGMVSALPGGVPSAQIAAVPVVIFGEWLEQQGSTNNARAFAVRYSAAPGASAAAVLDRNVLDSLGNTAVLNPGGAGNVTNDFTADTTAGGGRIYFKGSGSGGDVNLYSASLTPDANNRLVSALVIDQLVDFQVREDTQRILALRRDGTLYAGKLDAPAGLKPVLTGLPGGLPAIDRGELSFFGFTPDGANAWALTQYGFGGIVNNFLGSALVERVDLDSGARTDYGEIFFDLRFTTVPIGFLAGGSFAFGSEPLSAVSLAQCCNANARFFAATAAAGTSHVGIEPPMSIFQIGFHTPFTSVDGTEGAVFGGGRGGLVANNGAAFFAKSGTLYGSAPGIFIAGLNINSNVNFLEEAATWAPYGGPRLPASTFYSSNAQLWFKAFGNLDTNPRQHELLVTGIDFPTNTARAFSADRSDVLLSFGSNRINQDEVAVTRLRGIGKKPPVAPLP